MVDFWHHIFSVHKILEYFKAAQLLLQLRIGDITVSDVILMRIILNYVMR